MLKDCIKRIIDSAYYRVTHIEINKRLRLQKIQIMFKITETVKNGNEAIAEILKDKDLNQTEINHLIYVAAMVIKRSKWIRMPQIRNSQSKNTSVG